MPYIKQSEKIPYKGMWIRFDPPFLDFGNTHLGKEIKKEVRIINMHDDKTLDISSIESPNKYFSIIQPKQRVLEPQETITFEVIFLPRKIGNVEQTLFINTSSSKLKYPLFGVATSNPFRLPTFLKSRIPLGERQPFKLSLYNPEKCPLQVTELYSSSPRVQILLNKSRTRVHRKELTIFPYEEKQIATAVFLEKNFTGSQSAFVRLTVNRTSTIFNGVTTPECEKKPPFKLIIPFDVDVWNVPAVYPKEWLLDFGVVHESMKTVKKPIIIRNMGINDSVTFDWIRQLPVVQKPIKLNMKNSMKIPDSGSEALLGNITFLYDEALATGKSYFSGLLRLHWRPNMLYSDLEIPWQARILRGALELEQQQLKFLLSEIRETQEKVRKITIKNTFEEPIFVNKIDINHDRDNCDRENAFKIRYLQDSRLLKSGEETEFFEIELAHCKWNKRIKQMDCPEDIIETKLNIHTNASVFNYDLLFYYGLVNYQVSTPDPSINSNSSKIAFGLTATGDQKCQVIMLSNKNPIDIALERYHIEDLPNYGISHHMWPMTSLEFGRRDVSHRKMPSEFPLNLKRHSTSIFEFCLGVAEQRRIEGTLAIESHFQVIRIPFEGKWYDGSMKIMDSPVKLPPSFPGKKVSAEFSMFSTFQRDLHPSSVIPNEIGIVRYIPNNKIVHAMTKTIVGKLEFDGRQYCKGEYFTKCECMGSLRPDNKCGKIWLSSLDKPHQSAKNDAELYDKFRAHFKKQESETRTSLTIMTTENVLYDFNFKPDFTWPRLAQVQTKETFLQHPIMFAQTAVTIPHRLQAQRVIKIKNPSDDYIMFQPVLLGDIQQNYRIEKALKDDYPYLNPKNDLNYSPDFAIVRKNVSAKNGEYQLPRPVIPPQSEETIVLTFIPNRVGMHEAVLLLRNNLTVLEPIRLMGKGVKEQIKLKDGNSYFTMLFRDDDLKDCYFTKPGELPFKKGSKTTLILENFSVIPSNIVHVRINGEFCASDGWEVQDCSRLSGKLSDGHMPISDKEKEPAYKEIKLKYRPDFSMLETQAIMDITTEFGGKFVFMLQSRVPKEHIQACRASIPRPPWEASCRKVIVAMMWILLFGIIIMGYIEANCVTSDYFEKVGKTAIIPASVIDPLMRKMYSHLKRKRPEAKVAPIQNHSYKKLLEDPSKYRPLTNDEVQRMIKAGEEIRLNDEQKLALELLEKKARTDDNDKDTSVSPSSSSRRSSSVEEIKPKSSDEIKEESLPEWANDESTAISDQSKCESDFKELSQRAKMLHKEMENPKTPRKNQVRKRVKTPRDKRKKASRSSSLSSSASSVQPVTRAVVKPTKALPVEDIPVSDSTDSSSGHDFLPPTKSFLTRDHIRSVKLESSSVPAVPKLKRSETPPKPDSGDEKEPFDPFGLNTLGQNVERAIQRQENSILNERPRVFDPAPGRNPRPAPAPIYQHTYNSPYDSYQPRYGEVRYRGDNYRPSEDLYQDRPWPTVTENRAPFRSDIFGENRGFQSSQNSGFLQSHSSPISSAAFDSVTRSSTIPPPGFASTSSNATDLRAVFVNQPQSTLFPGEITSKERKKQDERIREAGERYKIRGIWDN
ncbi:unnamed protein product [Oikopleura dioica]|uniref:Uncharacterized protein n=1 Tax=Oikopleura dioica TaxID=34765 RepID=E4YEL8_OIKDI|nr:unnamed protein product [Oikopleura dioica]